MSNSPVPAPAHPPPLLPNPAQASDPNSFPDACPGNPIADILTQFMQHQLSFAEATARFQALMGNQPNLPPMINLPPRPEPPRVPLQFAHLRQRPNRWAPEEDERLLAAIQEHGVDNWPAIAALVGGGRTRSQCAQRWHRGLDPKLNKKNWTGEEEQRLIDLVQLHGEKAWTRVAAEFGDRSDVQCRFRYRFLVKKSIELGTQIQPIASQKGAVEDSVEPEQKEHQTEILVPA
jgi:hypothetical protein